MCVCLYIYTHTHTHTYMFARGCVCVCVCVYIYIYIYIYIYTNPASCKMDTESFPADHSHPSSAAVTEEQSYASTHPLGHTGPVTGSLNLYIYIYIYICIYIYIYEGMWIYMIISITKSFCRSIYRILDL